MKNVLILSCSSVHFLIVEGQGLNSYCTHAAISATRGMCYCLLNRICCTGIRVMGKKVVFCPWLESYRDFSFAAQKKITSFLSCLFWKNMIVANNRYLYFCLNDSYLTKLMFAYTAQKMGEARDLLNQAVLERTRVLELCPEIVSAGTKERNNLRESWMTKLHVSYCFLSDSCFFLMVSICTLQLSKLKTCNSSLKIGQWMCRDWGCRLL